jgi:cytochrome c biogenesis protein CcmG/thiol:disulfide interchange protein DsbE
MATRAPQVRGARGSGAGGDGPAPRSSRPRPVFLLVGVVLAAALGIGLFTTAGKGSGPGRPQVGSAVPSFSLPALVGGGDVGVPADGGGAGRPAVLLFFASWCTPCRAEIPGLAATYRHEQATHSRLASVRVIGVDGSDPTGDARSFVRRSGVTFPVGADRIYSVTQGLFAFAGLPESVLVDGDGTIAGIHYGALSPAAFVSWQRKLLTNA